MAALDEFLHPDAVCADLEAADAADVITALADRLLALGKVRPGYAAAVIARERTMPTGLPLGSINVAVPHTDVEHVLSPALAMAVLRHPVLFGSMDDPDERIPVRIVIAMALTNKDAQIDMLQRIAGLIQDEGALGRLAAVRTPADVMAACRQLGD